MIKREGTKFILLSKDGKRKLGTFDTKEAAQKREQQIQKFKAKPIDKSADKSED